MLIMTHKAFTYFPSCVFTMVYKSNPFLKKITYSFHWNHLMGCEKKILFVRKGIDRSPYSLNELIQVNL
jgi:hypothetical protein